MKALLGLALALFVALFPAIAVAKPTTTRAVYARLTCYNDYGGTADGIHITAQGWTLGGSSDLPFGSLVTFPNGEQGEIQDRGYVPRGNGTEYAPSWIDQYDPYCTIAGDWLTWEYGSYVWVTLEEPY